MSEEIIPGTPDEVWAAITTDSGAWSFQVDVDGDTARIHREPFAPDATAPSFTLVRTNDQMFAISCFSMDAVTLSVNVTGRLYGPNANAATERRRWQDWLTRL